MGLITQSGSISSGAGAKAALVIPANFSGKEPRPSLRKRAGSCKTQLMLETHTHSHTNTCTYTHNSLSCLYTPLFTDSAMGKGCRLPVSLPPAKKAGTFLGSGGSPCSPAARARGLLSRGAELCAAPAPWCVVSRQNRPDASPPLLLSFPRVLQLGVRDGVGNTRQLGVQLSFQKAGFSEVIKQRTIASFTRSQPTLLHCVPFSGCGSQKAGAASRGGRVWPRDWEKGNSRYESGTQGAGSRIFMWSP